MKRQEDKTAVVESDEMLEHYQFNYDKAKPNRFAERIGKESLMVVLDPDVAATFPTAKLVNETLRAIAAALANLPKAKASQRRKKSRA